MGFLLEFYKKFEYNNIILGNVYVFIVVAAMINGLFFVSLE